MASLRVCLSVVSQASDRAAGVGGGSLCVTTDCMRPDPTRRDPTQLQSHGRSRRLDYADQCSWRHVLAGYCATPPYSAVAAARTTSNRRRRASYL